MMKKLLIIAVIAASLAFSNNISAQYLVAEFKPFADAANTIPNRIRMDRNEPYTHGVDGVEAQFYSVSNDLVIALNLAKTKRATVYDFSEVASSVGAPAWITSAPIQTFKPFINVLKAYEAKVGCAPVGGVYNCNFVTKMNSGYLTASGDRASYAMLWNPEASAARKVNSPEMTSFVNVNYQKNAQGAETFTITPLPNCATRANNFTCADTDIRRVIAGLEKTSGKTVTAAGQYVMPFTLVVRPR